MELAETRRRATGAVLAALMLAGCGARSQARKVIVLGVDGMDPGFVERHWAELPNLEKLKRGGGFRRLATTTPPQSPVAWTTFITGLDPGAHGVFDFVERDAATMEPYSSFGRVEETGPRLRLGPYTLPLWPARVVRQRKGEAFWSLLARRGVPAAVIRIPENYPPVRDGEALAGMGTPDLRGTLGTFTFYTDDPERAPGKVAGGEMVRVEARDGHVTLPLEGPPNTLRKDRRPATARIEVDIDPERPAARVASGGETEVLKEGEWSGWMPAQFVLVPGLASSRGMFRMYVKQLHPLVEIYVSPVNADPESPALPLAWPKRYGRELAAKVGRFYTLGIPEDTAALRQGVFDRAEFLSQSRLVGQDERRLLGEALRRYQGGLLFFYFSSVDQNSHILWGRHEDELLRVYQEVDEAVGEVEKREPEAVLVVMSDHGFSTFDRAVHLNRWLAGRGWLKAAPDGEIDWAGTRAYAMGLNGLYVNTAGREEHGTVPAGAGSRKLVEEIRRELLAWKDPVSGKAVVETVAGSGAEDEWNKTAPDAVIGYAPGYRASWETALGEAGAQEIDDNDDAWIADHCINAADVPGVLFSSVPVRVDDPRLKDLTVSLLGLYGVKAGAGMTGREILR